LLTVRDLIRRSHKTAVEKGWWERPVDIFETKVALIHSEISEALEYWRDGIPHDQILYEHKSGWDNSPWRDYGSGRVPGKPIGVAIEMADAVIRIADLCKKYKIPLEEALEVKMRYNETRPHRHGGKRI
jgi:NTP pyrophosphatase (non-canonical NTP hydrolase)